MLPSIALTILVTASAQPLDSNPVRMEVRVFYRDYQELASRLGPLLGELDIFTCEPAGAEPAYLVIGTTAEQLAAIEASGLKTEITWPDLREKFRAMTGHYPFPGSFRDFGYYFNYYESRDTVRRLAQNYPAICQLDSSRLSFQNRRFHLLKISDNVGSTENEPELFINGATHAREPMGTHTCVDFACRLLKGYGTDSMLTWLVNNREIYIMPVMNPDGYVYNSDSSSDGYWRKNRHVIVAPDVGVDLNRNYGYHWAYNNSGSSPTPSSETYRGPARFSETETQVIRDFMLGHKFRVQQDFHTYGRYNLLPWGFSTAWPPDSATYKELGDSLYANNGYTTGPTMAVLYETNGGSVDWEYADTVWNGNPKFITYAVSTEEGINDFWYGYNDPVYIENEIARNTPNCCYLARVAGAFLQNQGVTINDSILGSNRSGQLDAGETADVWIALRNQALHPLDSAKNVNAMLLCLDTQVVRVLTANATFPDILRRSVAANTASQFRISCRTGIPAGTLVRFRLDMTYTDDGLTITQPLWFSITIGPYADVGCQRVVAPRGSLDSGAAVIPSCTLYNYGLNSQNYPVRMRIGASYDNTVQVANHAPGTKVYVTFPSFTARERSGILVACSTELAQDLVPANNRDTTRLFVRVNDMAPCRIVVPVGIIDSNTSYTPACSVENAGNTDYG